MPKGFEWIIILIIVIIIFGPKALPQLGSTLGKTVKNIREGMSDEDEENKSDDSDEVVVSEEDQEIAELEAKLAEAKAKKAANEDDGENDSPISKN